MKEEEEKPPVKVCSDCGKTLKHETIFLFDMDFIKKYTFFCSTCDIRYEVYVNHLTKHRRVIRHY